MVTVRKSKLIDVESNTYYFEFDIDTIAELPEAIYNGAIVAHGSKARIINTGDVYRINGENEWCAQTSGGGASLPEVTSEDNGDVLTVVDGAWDKAEPAKSGVLVFTAKRNSGSSQNVAILDDGLMKKDVFDAIKNNKTPAIIVVRNNSETSVGVFNLVYKSGGGYVFVETYIFNSTSTYNEFTIDNNATSGAFTITETNS